MPETADRRSAVQLWVLLVTQRRYTGSRMPAPQRQRLGCGGCMDGRAEQGSSQAAEKRQPDSEEQPIPYTRLLQRAAKQLFTECPPLK